MGTTSTNRQRSHVYSLNLWTSHFLGNFQLLTSLRSLSKHEQSRAAFLVAAAGLAAAGVLLPHVEPSMLSAALIAAAAIYALAGLTDAEVPDNLKPQTRTEPAPASMPRIVRNRPQTLHDLQYAGEVASRCDLAHWQRLTQRMSHELRTPLNAVLGFSELIGAEVYGPLGNARYVDYAKSINSSGRVLLKSAEDALAITNLLTGAAGRNQGAVASMRAAVNDMLSFHGPDLARTAVKLDVSVAADIEIASEPQTLRQIAINVMAECLAHAGASDGSSISIMCDARRDDVSLSIAVLGGNPNGAVKESSFSLMLTRTLVQLSQARMIEDITDAGWSVTLTFPRAAQKDFFQQAA